MKITQDVRDYAATLQQGFEAAGAQIPSSTQNGDAREAGMAEMSEKFKAMGNEVYVEKEKVKESNRVL